MLLVPVNPTNPFPPDKAEDGVIAKKQAEVKAAADARQVVVDAGARKKAYTTKDYVEGAR